MEVKTSSAACMRLLYTTLYTHLCLTKYHKKNAPFETDFNVSKGM